MLSCTVKVVVPVGEADARVDGQIATGEPDSGSERRRKKESEGGRGGGGGERKRRKGGGGGGVTQLAHSE